MLFHPTYRGERSPLITGRGRKRFFVAARFCHRRGNWLHFPTYLEETRLGAELDVPLWCRHLQKNRSCQRTELHGSFWRMVSALQKKMHMPVPQNIVNLQCFGPCIW